MPEAEAGGGTGFERAADAAAIAGLTLGGLGRGAAVEVDGLLVHGRILNQGRKKCSKHGSQPKEMCMQKFLSILVAALFAVGSVSAIACGDKSKDEKQMSTPTKTKV